MLTDHDRVQPPARLARPGPRPCRAFRKRNTIRAQALHPAKGRRREKRERQMGGTSRPDFIKLAAAGAAGAALGRPAQAAGKTITILHESSFIPPFDEYIKTTLAQAYEKETGIKIVYEI